MAVAKALGVTQCKIKDHRFDSTSSGFRDFGFRGKRDFFPPT